MSIGYNYWVYILLCSDGSYYTGVTNDIERRLWEHETGYNKTCYTFTRRPLEIKYCQHFDDINLAIAWEKQLKGWSRKKERGFNKWRLGGNQKAGKKQEKKTPLIWNSKLFEVGCKPSLVD